MHFNKSIFHLVGDMLILNKQTHSRNLAIDLTQTWPAGFVYYQFNENFSIARQAFIREKMNEFESITNQALQFIVKTPQQNHFIQISEFDEGCYANVGRLDISLQPQMMNIGFGCLTNSIVKHELMHAIGFYHEHSRLDRNNFVQVLAHNIQDGKQENFDVVPNTDNLGLEYDYNSILHYSSNAFSKNGNPTIVSKTTKSINPSSDMTFNDVDKIRKLYNIDVVFSNAIKLSFNILLFILILTNGY